MSDKNGTYTYYPGCSIKSTSPAYDESTLAVAGSLGMTFNEIEDWNCCGATEYFSVNQLPAYSLVARNLSLAVTQQGNNDIVAPCSACFLNLRKTNDYMVKHKDLNQKVNQALKAGGISYEPGSLQVRHLLDVIVQDIGYDQIKEKMVKPLTGIKIAPYYGCLIVRPDTGYNTEYPTHLDELMTTLGAEVVDFPMKTHCCGGHMTQISEDTAYELLRRILKNATDYGADAIVTLCPMCQLNLDAYQGEVNKRFGTNYNLPITFFTQLMGIAFGLTEKELGIGSEIVSYQPVLNKIGQESDEKKRRRPKRRDKNALPMPGSDGGS